MLMEEDLTKIYDEYEEQIMVCKFFVAKKLNHRPEMGRAGENILLGSLRDRFKEMEFVSGFLVVDGRQSPQCDILVCRKNMHRRELAGGIFLVVPEDCYMVIEVKSNMTIADFDLTLKKNEFFRQWDNTRHIKLALFAFQSCIGKRELYRRFGYRYDKDLKGYIKTGLGKEQLLDCFICIHRKQAFDKDTSKQLFFIKDGEDGKKYECMKETPVMRNLWNVIGAFSWTDTERGILYV